MKIKSAKISSLTKFIFGAILLLLLSLFLKYNIDKNNFQAFRNSKESVGMVSPDSVETMTLKLDFDSYRKLNAVKNKALEAGILITGEEDIVLANVEYQDKEYPAEIRLKGDWVEHLMDETWSFRVKVEKDQTIMGMRKFSLQHPRSRNYAGEWLFHEVLAAHDILSLPYEFLNVNLEISDNGNKKLKKLGYYALEGFFDKQLIERNSRREGVIVKLDEDPTWTERRDIMKLGISSWDLRFVNVSKYDKLDVVPFEANRILEDPSLRKQFEVASSKFEAFTDQKAKPSDVYDVEKLANYNAICNLLGSHHSMAIHNLRAYYNPINSKLEPIGFDGNSLHKIDWFPVFDYGIDDLVYMEAYLAALEKVSQDDFVEKVINWPGLKETIEKLERSYPKYKFDTEVIPHHKRIIQNFIHPTKYLNIFYIDHGADYLHLSIDNYNRFPAEVHNITTPDGKEIGIPTERCIIANNESKIVEIKLNKNFDRLFVSKKKGKTKFNVTRDVASLIVKSSILGVNKFRNDPILPWNASKQIINALPNRESKSILDYPFIEIDEENKRIRITPGYHPIPTTGLIIPAGYVFEIGPGTTLDLNAGNQFIISHSPVEFIGTKEKPIKIFSSTGLGNGLLVLGNDGESILENCIFDNLSNPKNGYWSVSGGVNFHEANVRISNCSFLNSRSEDALNIIRTDFEMNNVVFNNNKSDAFDGDFVNGIISNSVFGESGNDGIDVSGSTIKVVNTIVTNSGDKALSAGESSKIIASHCGIDRSEIAVASKDNSTITLDSCEIRNNSLGFTAFQKKSEFGPGEIIVTNSKIYDNDVHDLIETNSSMTLDGELMEYSDQVIERMYGAEFGKKSQ